MIRARYERDDSAHRLYIIGHAGKYAESGADIVCAAVSVLFFTVTNMTDGKNVASAKKGHSEVLCERGKREDVLFEFVVYGLTELSEAYPDYIEFEKEIV